MEIALNDTSPRWGSAALAMAASLASVGVSIPNVALPAMATAFDAPFDHVRWVVVAYLLAITVMVVLAGRLGDLVGRRRALLGGLALFAAASATCALASDLPTLIAARVIQGLGAAVLTALTVAMVGETVGAERTGAAMGLLGTMSAVGTALGPSLGGVLVAGPGWRAVFWVMVPAAAAVLILAARFLPADPARGERRTPVPLIGGAAFAIPGLPAGLIMNAAVAAVMMTTLVVGTFHLSRALGLSAATAGMVMAVGPVISMLTGIPAGRLVDRLGTASALSIALAMMTAGTFGLSLAAEHGGVVGYVLAIAALTPGYQLFQSANNTGIMAGVPKDRRGLVSGTLGVARNLGLITGAWAMGAVFAVAVGRADMSAATPDAVAAGTRITFIIAGCVMLAALALSRMVTTRR